MSTDSSTNIVKNNILAKPYLIDVDELEGIGQNLNLVGYDTQLDIGSDDSIINLSFDNSSSPKLLNYVESYLIDGEEKTLFYTEVNSGFSIGDKVFIINGTYDSNELIRLDKYRRGNDGYEVLYVDRCLVVLDIKFSGLLPSDEVSTITDKYDEFIKVYYVKDDKDFLLVNRQLSSGFTSSLPLSISDRKFNKNQNAFIYVDKIYNGISNNWGICNPINEIGFYYRDGNNWISVNNEILTSNYTNLLGSINTNNKLFIINGSFNFMGFQFNEGVSYIHNGTNWEISVTHENNNTPIISRSNLRDGYFNGKWNGGCYGSNNKRIKWNRNNSIWNSGTLLNTQWKWGIMNSLYTQKASFVSELGSDNKPYQKVVNFDNDGYGYNFIINSELENYVINNGNLSNSILGTGATISIVEDHLNNIINSSYISSNFGESIVNKSVFDNCFILNSNIENSIIKNSRSMNSRFLNVKSINSHFKSSVFKNSNYISDNSIKILDYISYNFSTYTVYKFFINKRNFEKFKFKDIFYIKGIKEVNSSIFSDFDIKFKIGIWLDYKDTLSTTFIKYPIEYSAFLSTPLDNKLFRNDYSIDIFINHNYNLDIDISNAYILNSDFESGIFENSNWNSGYHINNNNDNNITKADDFIYSNNSPILTISLTSSNNNLIIDTRSLFKETEFDYYDKGEILFFNNITYDTSGTVLDFDIYSGGSGYSTSENIVLDGIYGRELLVDFKANEIGGVATASWLNLSSSGSGYLVGDIKDVIGVISSGIGMKVLINDTIGVDITIINPGTGYKVNDSISIDSGGQYSNFIINRITNGEIISVDIKSPGIGYGISEVITIPNGLSASLIVTNIGGYKKKLGDSYKIISTNQFPIILEPIGTPLGITQSHGIFTTNGAYNRYNYIHKTKFVKSKIISGIFKRTYFNECLIKNNSYDINDKDFTNINSIKELIVNESIFKGNSNILSNAIYINSYLINNDLPSLNDKWDNGILYNSIWDNLIFNNGLIKESTWINGEFLDGLFYNSNTYNNIDNDPYSKNRISSYYKSGHGLNNRFSWQGGTFKGGEFYKSDWEGGEFLNGKFYYSKFYDGDIQGGIMGDKSIGDTYIYNGNITYTTVENARIYSDKSTQFINWKNGIFNAGIFGSSFISNSYWHDGVFNGGQFMDNALWLNGVFNGGRFLSTHKYDIYKTPNSFITPLISNYSWQNGIFNGGEFGNGTTGSNSTWFNGEWNNGVFNGKEWNSGIFLYGEFNGSGLTATGGYTCSNANYFVNTFIDNNWNFYGLWRNGFFTDIKNKFTNNKEYDDSKRVTNSTIIKRSIMKNSLWMNGIFNHPGGEFKNSIWMNGEFENGLFNKSSFNPFINSNFNNLDTCIWKNGKLLDSEFFISKWLNGNFISGTATGMLWKNGIVNYMNAYNVYWEDGIWKNGNWNGSYFNVPSNGIITDEYVKQVLNRIISFGTTSSCHIWNIFYQDDISNVNNSL